MHEFVLSGGPAKRELEVKTLDIAKRLLDYGFHPPTIYFPLLVDEALMVEPTETETRESLDELAEAIESILAEAEERPGDPRDGARTRRRSAASTRRPRAASRSSASRSADSAAEAAGGSPADAARMRAGDDPRPSGAGPRRLLGAGPQQRDQLGGGVERVGDHGAAVDRDRRPDRAAGLGDEQRARRARSSSRAERGGRS